MRKIHGWILITFIFFVSCNHDMTIETSNETDPCVQNNLHFVSFDDALNIAYLQKDNKTKSSEYIKNYLEVRNKSNLPEYYIINYVDGGFVIISGDDRLSPVLAYSDEGYFSFDKNMMPGGLSRWMYSTSLIIDSLRNTDQVQNFIAEYSWNKVKNGPMFLDINKMPITTKSTANYDLIWEFGEETDIDDCSYTGHIIAEYYLYVDLDSIVNWGQLDGFNNHLDDGNCNIGGAYPTDRYPVGCSVVAVGQIMMYNRYPTTGFDWDAIYNNGYSDGYETCEFLKNLGLPINLDIEYTCDGSGPSDNDNPLNYLIDIGFTHAHYSTGISPITIRNNLSNGRPIIFCGEDSSGDYAHMWVCEGIKSYYAVTCFAAGGSYDTIDELEYNKQYFYMNWGWYGSYNGWYLIYDFTPDDDDWSYNVKTIVDIY